MRLCRPESLLSRLSPCPTQSSNDLPSGRIRLPLSGNVNELLIACRGTPGTWVPAYDFDTKLINQTVTFGNGNSKIAFLLNRSLMPIKPG